MLKRPQVSRNRRRYQPHFVEPFARKMGPGERNLPPPVFPTSEDLDRYVEDFDEPRTMFGTRRVSARRGWAGEKGDFFSILLRYG